MISYFICSTPRSGTGLLRSILNQYSLGNPIEVHKELIRLQVKLSEFYEKCATNSVQGTTLHYLYFGSTLKHLGKLFDVEVKGNWHGVLEQLFPKPKFIYVYRRNVIKQAISYLKAQRTGHWRRKDFITDFGEYNSDEIQRCCLSINVSNALWEQFFEEYRIDPYFITYEDIVKKKDKVAWDIANFLDVRKLSEKTLEKRQYDGTSEEWYFKFIREVKLEVKGDVKLT